MISLDGTRPSDLDDTELVTLRALRGLGAVAERLQPEFPTNTFPSHMTLVTGVAPEVHGIVNNVFDDPEGGVFRYENDPSWSEVEPIWAIAARNGVVSAAYYWIGSEGPWRNGFGPRHWESFSNRTSESQKVEQILAWLDLEDPAERPRLITSWFHGADGAGHEHGPGSGPVRDALRRQDRALATLVDGIAARGGFDAVTLLLVSDHGMALVERHLDLKAEFHRAGLEAKVLGGGGGCARLAAGWARSGGSRGVDRDLVGSLRSQAGVTGFDAAVGQSALRRSRCDRPGRNRDHIRLDPAGFARLPSRRAGHGRPADRGRSRNFRWITAGDRSSPRRGADSTRVARNRATGMDGGPTDRWSRLRECTARTEA